MFYWWFTVCTGLYLPPSPTVFHHRKSQGLIFSLYILSLWIFSPSVWLSQCFSHVVHQTARWIVEPGFKQVVTSRKGNLKLDKTVPYTHTHTHSEIIKQCVVDDWYLDIYLSLCFTAETAHLNNTVFNLLATSLLTAEAQYEVKGPRTLFLWLRPLFLLVMSTLFSPKWETGHMIIQCLDKPLI